MKHTKEPWVISEIEPWLILSTHGYEAGGLSVATSHGSAGSVTHERSCVPNAKRIVACVNALAGIENLEAVKELIEVAYQVAKAQTNMKDPTGAIHRLKIVLRKLDQAREGKS